MEKHDLVVFGVNEKETCARKRGFIKCKMPEDSSFGLYLMTVSELASGRFDCMAA